MSQAEGTVTIEHKLAPGHRNEFVNGMSTAGPLDDGLVRLVFYRDALPPLSEVLKIDPRNPAKVLAGSAMPVDVQLYREDVVTMLIHPKALVQMGEALISLSRQIQAQPQG